MADVINVCLSRSSVVNGVEKCQNDLLTILHIDITFKISNVIIII